MARYWPWRAETVIAGRPAASELAIALSNCGSGLRRDERARASILLARWSLSVEEDILREKKSELDWDGKSLEGGF